MAKFNTAQRVEPTPVYESPSMAQGTPNWDIFRLLPVKPDNVGNGFWLEVCLQILKISSFLHALWPYSLSAFVAKSTFLLMVAGIGHAGRNVTICADKIPESKYNEVQISTNLAAKWAWAALLALCAPELVCFARCFHRTMFQERETAQHLPVFIVETLHGFGIGALASVFFPHFPSPTCEFPAFFFIASPPAAMLGNAVCLVPAVFGALSRRPNRWSVVLLVIDLCAIGAQTSSTFVSVKSFLPPVQWLAAFSARLAETRSKTYVLVSLWKCFLYIFCLIPLSDLLQRNPFGEKLITITARDLNQTQIGDFLQRMRQYETPDYRMPSGRADEEEDDEKAAKTTKRPWDPDDLEHTIDTGEFESVKPRAEVEEEQKEEGRTVEEEQRSRGRRQTAEDEEEVISAYNVYDDYVELNQFTTPYDALWIALVQVMSVVVLMQRMGFALPVFLVVPATVVFLVDSCASRAVDPCFMSSLLSKELFWECGPQTAPFLVVGLLAAAAVVDLGRLVVEPRLFVHTWSNSFFVDQSLAFNRRRDDKVKILSEDLDLDGEENSETRLEPGLIRGHASTADEVTKIYACATLWHETGLEMTCMLKSIFRMDEDQSAHKNAQRLVKVVHPDYYLFEAHILIDDAFYTSDYGEPLINRYVRQFIEKVDEAASAVHKTQMRLTPPTKMTTPYGGRLVYLLPGGNTMVLHLKDKNKIRKSKALVSSDLMSKVSDQQRKEVITESMFILTLDGDVDFTPKCVRLLVDLMKKNRRLGAACGRIHPRGSGPMIWYQKFEYAVGHWLQKATEHMIGCVLCSPGCFSLFRASALMDDGVGRRYAMKHELMGKLCRPKRLLSTCKYDQGEDRWLCTLLLQRGYRVEYCAASDALTFAPEGFAEFFNQRRRWISSTMANVIDLLRDYKNVVAVNESISIWYIRQEKDELYQLLMLISSILGPGTIFLMIVGAISISFEIDTKISLAIVTIPVVLFCVICLILFAEIISAIFAMLMTAVIVGTMLQIQKDGVTSPHSIFLITVTTSFTVSAILHPLEFTCILPAVLYFLAIPCMYMLLPIYSICNMNNVNWGTRESPNAGKEENKNAGVRLDLVEGGMGPQAEGEFSFGCGNMCRLMCCLGPDRMEASPQIWKLNEGMREISKKLDQMERRHAHDETRRNSTRTDADADTWPGGRRAGRAGQRGNRKWKNLRSEAWLSDKQLKRADRDFLEGDEEQFWNEVIEKYLQPIAMDSKVQEEIRVGLTELRQQDGGRLLYG
ncbi:Chitin synthase [Aphelenchoides fujianensis]|nr:Chitin synthase [Aphelenchoides fujianensis]